MRYLSYLVVLLLILSPLVASAQSPIDRRRIEEEKRDNLRLSEIKISEKTSIFHSQPGLSKQAYFNKLVSKKNATLFDAYTMLVILLGLEDRYPDFKAKQAFLRQQDILPRAMRLTGNPHQSLEKGVAAYMFCRALKIKGGLWLRLFGITERYALRELVFQCIMFPGNTRDIVSGKELVFIVTQAANYLAQKYPGVKSGPFRDKTEIKK